MATEIPPDLWDSSRVAQFIGMSQRYVEQLVREGRIPYTRFGRNVRFHPDELNRWALARHSKTVR